MKLVVKFILLSVFAGGLLFARIEDKSARNSQKNIKNNYYIVKDHFDGKSDNKLDRKRVHKRRRKIRKPVKGLR